MKRRIVRLPEQPLEDRILDLAAPRIAGLGAEPAPEAVRDVVERTVRFWNAKLEASAFWDRPRPGALRNLERQMTGRAASTEDAAEFERLSQTWIAQGLAGDPRRVRSWSLEGGCDSPLRLSCEMELPPGVEALAQPPLEQRIAIGGRFLDEVRIRMTGSTSRVFPTEAHRGALEESGVLRVRTMMATAAALLAEGVLPPIGGPPVGMTVQAKEFAAMVLAEIRCDGDGYGACEATLSFRPASTPTASDQRGASKTSG